MTPKSTDAKPAVASAEAKSLDEPAIKVVMVAVIEGSMVIEVESRLAEVKGILQPRRFRAEVRVMAGLPDPEKAYEP